MEGTCEYISNYGEPTEDSWRLGVGLKTHHLEIGMLRARKEVSGGKKIDVRFEVTV
jgi:hypothetical protein